MPLEEQKVNMKEVNDLLPHLDRLETWVNGGFREYQIREADKALTTMEARGIQHNVFQQGRLAYYYDAGREVPVGCFGYHRVTKTEALADWQAFMHAANPPEIEWMEKLGCTPDVRAFLESCPDLGVGLKTDTECACVPERIDWAYQELKLQGDPIWEFLKAKAVQVVQWEEKLKKLVMEDNNRKRNLLKFWQWRKQPKITEVCHSTLNGSCSGSQHGKSSLMATNCQQAGVHDFA